MSTPREYPILFKPEMVRAIFEGRKTETRRLNGLDTINKSPDLWTVTDQRFGLGYPASEDRYYAGFGNPGDPVYVRSPYGGPGDTLWVRETWGVFDSVREGQEVEVGEPVPWSVHYGIGYRADGEGSNAPTHWLDSPEGWKLLRADEKWRPSIHLPRWACGLLLRVEEVRVERLQEISEAGAQSEGVAMPDGTPEPPEWWSYRQEFAHLWDEINASRAPWSDNPWIWVVRFSPIQDELWSARAS